jgi:hypothetical protein
VRSPGKSDVSSFLGSQTSEKRLQLCHEFGLAPVATQLSARRQSRGLSAIEGRSPCIRSMSMENYEWRVVNRPRRDSSTGESSALHSEWHGLRALASVSAQVRVPWLSCKFPGLWTLDRGDAVDHPIVNSFDDPWHSFTDYQTCVLIIKVIGRGIQILGGVPNNSLCFF